MKKTSNKKFLAAIASCGLISALGIGGTLAYLTDSESHTNTFTYGNVQIDLVEESWDDTATAAHVMVPQRAISKDPKVMNTGTEPAVLMMKVEMPYQASASVIGNDGTPAAQTNVPNFIMETMGSGWTQIGSPTFDATSHKVTYVYGYDTVVAGAAETSELFQQVRMANFAQGQVNTGDAGDVKVYGYGIQSEGMSIAGSTITAQELSDIWTLVVNSGEAAPEADSNGSYNHQGGARS